LQEVASTLKEGWTGSVVWPGTEHLASEEGGLRHWAWGAQGEEGVPVRSTPAPPTNLTRRGRRRAKEGLQDAFNSKEVFQTQVNRYCTLDRMKATKCYHRI